MYCKKCGKFIGTDSDLCDECSKNSNEVFSEFAEKKEETTTPKGATPNEYTPKANTTNPTYNTNNEINLGRAIAGAILGFVGFLISYIAVILLAELLVLDPSDVGGAMVAIIFSVVPSVISLVFGIKSIANFKSTSHVKNGKRIPLLILGISSVVLAGLSLFLVFIIFVILMIV